MSRILKLLAYVFYVAGLLVILVLPSHQYDWMQQMDPSIGGVPENSGSNNGIFALLLLLSISAGQIFVILKTRNRAEKIAGIALIFLAMGVWLVKF